MLWRPSTESIAQTNLAKYETWLRQKKNLTFNSYHDLWHWSVTDIESFWESIWEYFEIIHEGSYKKVLQGSMPLCRWFEGTKLNYAEHIFRKATDSQPAIIFKSENTDIEEISWATLTQQVSSLQHYL